MERLLAKVFYQTLAVLPVKLEMQFAFFHSTFAIQNNLFEQQLGQACPPTFAHPKNKTLEQLLVQFLVATFAARFLSL